MTTTPAAFPNVAFARWFLPGTQDSCSRPSGSTNVLHTVQRIDPGRCEGSTPQEGPEATGWKDGGRGTGNGTEEKAVTGIHAGK